MRGGVRGALVRGLGACSAVLTVALCAARPARAAFDGIGLSEVLGPGAVGLAGEAARATGNPALLARVPFADASLGAGVAPGTSPWQRVDLVWPALRGDAVAIATERQVTDGSVAIAAALGYGRGLGAGFDVGGTVELRTNESGTASGFGLNAGAVYAPQRAAGISFGVHLRDVVRSVPTVADAPETRRLEAGIAQRFQLSRHWRGTATAGFEAVRGAAGAAWLGARIAWRDRFMLAAAGTQDEGRAGAGLRCGAAWLEYALQSGADEHHSLGVRWVLGAPVETRRLAAAARAESSLAAHVASAMAEREQRAIETRLADAEAALTSAECERASELFREVLLWSPDHAGARDGLRRAQRGALFVQADSALARGDWRHAADQLEHASRLFPQDSLTTAKLENVRGVAHRADRTRSEAAEQVRLGLEAYTQQRWAVAARFFEAALRLDPANEVGGEFLPRARSAGDAQITAALDQARARLEKRDPTGARAALTVVLAEPPLRADVQQLVTQIDREAERLAEERRVAEAREREVAAREDRSPPPVTRAHLQAAYDRGLQHYRAGDLPSALEAWEGVARQAPHFGEVDRYLLRVYRVVGLESYTEGRLQAAIDLWTKALTLEPENPQVRRYLDQANAKLQRAGHPRGSR